MSKNLLHMQFNIQQEEPQNTEAEMLAQKVKGHYNAEIFATVNVFNLNNKIL